MREEVVAEVVRLRSSRSQPNAYKLSGVCRFHHNLSGLASRLVTGRMSDMSATEILRELPKLSPSERRAILDRLIELDEDGELLNERRSQADEAFQLLDAMEAEDAEGQAR
jgi:hypothetical protein